MDLNEKLAQRRKEREQEAAVVQAEIEAKDLAIKAANAKTEFEKQVAQSQLAYGGVKQVIDTDIKKYIQNELIIEKMAWSRWTRTEFLVGLLFVGVTVLGFFQNWFLGILFFVISIFYYQHNDVKYRIQIISELGGQLNEH